MSKKAYRKSAHPTCRGGGYQGYEETDIADTLNIYDISEARTTILVVEKANERKDLLYRERSDTRRGMSERRSIENAELYERSYENFEGGCQPVSDSEYVVRRLTCVECERLQGFPDGWTDIPGASDTARYKALGNSIALPQWQIIIDNMAKYLPDGATLGSLFDGIGGFPLCWERTHGKGTAIWASEIEKFPIEVTKIQFPEK